MENATIVETAVVERLTQAERRSQIEVAKQYPREISRFKKTALQMATADEETAAGCFYSMPRAGSRIEGPSVRLAEIVASAWGNLRAQARVIDVTATHIVAEGAVWDLETNFAASIEVRRKITGKNGNRFSEDMITVTGNAAASIAFRNAVFKVIPAVYVNQIYAAARQVAVGDASTLVQRRSRLVEYAAKFGVSPEQICAALERADIEDITLDDLADLTGRFTAIKNDEITVDEAFAPVGEPDLPKEGRRSFGFKGKIQKKAATKAEAEPETGQAETLEDIMRANAEAGSAD